MHINYTLGDPWVAIGICEGFIAVEDGDEVLSAWQFLIDSGLVWSLDGGFTDKAHELINLGLCQRSAAA